MQWKQIVHLCLKQRCPIELSAVAPEMSLVQLKKWILFLLLLIFWTRYSACGISVTRPGIEPGSSAVKVWSPNHWTTGEFPRKCILNFIEFWVSLVAQWLRICLLMQGTRVQALVWEDRTCHRAAGPVSHNYWACASGACAPRQWEACAPRWRVSLVCHN